MDFQYLKAVNYELSDAVERGCVYDWEGQREYSYSSGNLKQAMDDYVLSESISIDRHVQQR